MATAVYGVFKDRDNADQAIQRLMERGVAKDRVSVERATTLSADALALTEDERERFVSAVQASSLLLRVLVPDEEATDTRMALMRAGATTFLRTSSEDTLAAMPVDEVMHPGANASLEFHEHFMTEYAPKGASFDDYLPAYEFGYQYGLEAGHENSWKDWNQVYRDARNRWEAEHPGTWEQYELAVQEGWATAPVRLTSATMM